MQAFKNIRNRLFSQITEEIQREQQSTKNDPNKATFHTHSASITSQTRTINNNKLYLYLFHLFESVVSNVSQLVGKTMQTALRECNDLDLEEPLDQDKAKVNEKETINTINTIASGSELVTNANENKNGFFSENLKSIIKSKTSIEKAIDKISSQLLLYNQTGKKQLAMQEKVK